MRISKYSHMYIFYKYIKIYMFKRKVYNALEITVNTVLKKNSNECQVQKQIKNRSHIENGII